MVGEGGEVGGGGDGEPTDIGLVAEPGELAFGIAGGAMDGLLDGVVEGEVSVKDLRGFAIADGVLGGV